jgi:3-hydroxyisobutyrate dehydrogenase-like beta-hydroxyacid dehydrogenase
VATEAARHVREGQFFLDLNSVSPSTKRASCERIEAAGGHYVEAAVIASIPSYGIKVPMILGGKRAAELAQIISRLGMRPQAGYERVGVASAIKMCRSIMVKGLEALTIECLLTARRYGVEEQVLASLDQTYPAMNWQQQGDYLISRVVQHGRRRAAEMREVARTVKEAGLQPLLAAPTAVRHDWLADRVQEGTVSPGAKNWRAVADEIQRKEENRRRAPRAEAIRRRARR